jgi:galactosylceramidase
VPSSATRLSAISLLALLAPVAAQEVSLRVDGPGRVYEGIGALSAGASSRLLADYPEPQRAQILDLLFKPKYGASLQHLKVEIGGDVNSTCGTEPAFAHTREEMADAVKGIQRGYEGWLMQEARRRSPALLFDALQWGAPGWIGAGKFYSQDNADFIAAFHHAMKAAFGVEIAYQGIWNETAYDVEWIKLLRRTLDRAGLERVKLGVADQTGEEWRWKIAEAAEKDPELMRAIYAIGDHYVSYESSDAAKRTGKPLWANEDGPWSGDWHAATKLARLYNRSYISGKMTRFITWSLVGSYYDALPLPGSGLMRANEPWSGHFEVQPAIWAAAHYTQFTEPGWRYLDAGCGLLREFGSYVTLLSPDRQDFSVVIETMDSPYIVQVGRPQELVFRLGEGFPNKPVHVWKSNSQAQFVEMKPIQAENGVLRVHLEPESIYTLSTTTGQRKGGADLVVPESRQLALPYADAFEAKPAGGLARYFIDQSGAFEHVPCPDRPGGCLRQMVPAKGIEWRFHVNSEPYTLMGDARWRDYRVEVDARFDGPSTATVFGRIESVGTKIELPAGYVLKLDEKGAWTLGTQTRVIGQGQAKLKRGAWHRLGLSFQGERISVLVDGRSQTTVTDATYRSGLVGLGCGWQRQFFDNFLVR